MFFIRRSPLGSIVPCALSAILLSGLAGCGVSVNTFTPAQYSLTQPLVGQVHGGQQPVVGASMQLYAVGEPAAGGGSGLGAVPLITGTLPVTDANGSFSITGSYTAPTTPSHFYLVATGGSPGVGSPVNPNIALMTSIGSCTPTLGLSSTLNFTINEVTTAASILTLQPFLAPATALNTRTPAIGAAANANTSLRNAIETTNNLVNSASGGVINPTTNWTASTANGLLVNTMGDIIAACINSDPANSSQCSSLYSLSNAGNGAFAGADTIQATGNMVQNPSHNVPQLYNLITANGPFMALPSAPASFTVNVPTAAVACQSPVTLGSAANFEVLGASTVTNTGPTSISGGNLGLSPGTSVTGFPPGVLVLPAQMIVNNPVAAQAQLDLNVAYVATAGLAGGAVLPADISGLTFPPGLYKTTGAVLNAATVTLDGHGDPNAVFIFQIATALNIGGSSQIVLINGAQAKNVYWQVGSSATLGTASMTYGTIMAHTSITFNTAATLKGRALAQTGSVTMDSNAITAP